MCIKDNKVKGVFQIDFGFENGITQKLKTPALLFSFLLNNLRAGAYALYWTGN
jgi:hypothetical protein